MINPQPVPPRRSPYSTPAPRSLPAQTLSAPPRPPRNWKRIVLLSLACVLAAVTVYAYSSYKLLAHKVLLTHQGESASILAYDSSKSNSLDPSLFKKAGDGRFNVVVVGVGGDNHPGAYLTDSIQVVSLDTINKKASLTSLPRDLYVNIPGYGYNKINTAYQSGEEKSKGGGPLMVRQVVGNVLGITISNFVLVDFSGAKQLVDAVGCIDIDVPNTIDDPFFPDDATVGYKPFHVDAGPQHMCGATALSYARSRETTSDFDRSARQQLVAAALKKKVLSLGTLSNPAKITSLVTALGDHVKTDLQQNEILALAQVYRDIPAAQTQAHVLDTSQTLGLLADTTDPLAGYISYPIGGKGKYDAIRRWFQKNAPDPLLAKESPTVTVVPGAGTTGAQAKKMVDALNDYGYSATLGQTPEDKASYNATAVYDAKNQKPFSRNYLGSFFSAVAQDGSPLHSGSDFEVIYTASRT